MRPLLLVSVAAACLACRVSPPRAPAGLTIAVRATGQGSVSMPGPAPRPGQPPPPPAPPPPPPPPVALVGAPVVEFFGIPLDGVDEVVFVLDCSGSMDDPALGRLAAIPVGVLAEPPPVVAPPPVEPPPAIEPTGLPPAVIPGLSPPPDAAPPPVAPPPVAPPPVLPGSPLVAPPPPDALVVAPPPPPVPVVPTKLQVAKAELIDALRRLPPGTRVNILFFNAGVEALAPGFVTIPESAREAVIGFVLDRVARGATALTPAMRYALLMNARRIVLLSDGLGNVGDSRGALLRDAREAVRGQVRIDTIGLGRDQDRWLLESLARDSGGLYQAL